MMRLITMALSFLILPFCVAAQSLAFAPRPKTKKGYRGERWAISNAFAFSWAPLSLLDPYGALLQPGLNYYFGERYSAGFSIGLPAYYVLNNYRDKPHKEINSDYKLRLDVREYFRLREHSRLYGGAEVFYRRQNMTLSDSYMHYVDGSCYDYSALEARKIAFGTGIFLGIDYKLSEHFIAGGHIGAGLRMIQMKTNLDIAGMKPRTESSFSSLLPPNEDRVGDRDLNLYLPFLLKVGFLF